MKLLTSLESDEKLSAFHSLAAPKLQAWIRKVDSDKPRFKSHSAFLTFLGYHMAGVSSFTFETV